MCSKRKTKQEREELVQTQVLNIEEVRKVAKYERRISKKPAAICAFLGSVMILAGLGTQGYITYEKVEAREAQAQQDVVARREMKKEKKKEEKKVVKTTLKCTKSEYNEENGTSSETTFAFDFEDDKLKHEDKIFSLQAIEGNPKGGDTTYGLFLAYLSFQNININGYSIETKQVGSSGFQVKTAIDFTTINLEEVPQNYKSNPNLTPDFKLDTASAPIKETAESIGFTCTIE